MIVALLAALSLAGPPPLPDHPVSGKPVQPSWSYSYRVGPARCFVPLRGRRVCSLLIRWAP